MTATTQVRDRDRLFLCAIETGDVEKVKYMIKNGADFNKRDLWGKNSAAYSGYGRGNRNS